MRVALRLVALLVGAFALPSAAAADALIGAPWELPIREGIERQQRLRQTRSAEAILREAKLAAARRADPETNLVRVYLLARAYGIAEETASARRAYAEVLRRAPRCYFAYHDVAMLDLSRSPPDEASAERNLRYAISINPGYVTAQRKLAVLLLRGDRSAEALPFLQRVVDLAPEDAYGHLLLAQALLAQGRLAEAEREIQGLLGRDGQNPAYRDMLADLRLRQGRTEEARSIYRALALENPTDARPLRGVLRCLDQQRQEGGEVDVEAYLWALEGLYRLEPQGEGRDRLQRAIEEIRTYQASGPSAPREGPPTEQDLLQVLAGQAEEGRVSVMRYLYARGEPLSPPILRALIGALDPAREPSAVVRGWALRVLGRFGGYGLVGLVRHSLKDPDPSVRPVAVDVLQTMAEGHHGARAGALLALGLHVEDSDAVLAAAARRGVLALARATLDVPDDAGLTAQREAFRTWWHGPVAGETKVESLGRFHEVRDPAADQVLVPYLSDPDPYVLAAAWQALGRFAAGAGSDARGRWLQSLPPYAPEAVRAEQLEATRDRLRAWAAGRPR